MPGGLSVIIGILAVNVLAGIFPYTAAAVSTMCMLMAVAVAMWVVAKVSMPFTTARKVILGSAIGLFILCIIFLRGFFDVAPISLPQAVVVCVFTAVAPFMMRGFERIVEKRADKFLSKKIVRRSLQITDDELKKK